MLESGFYPDKYWQNPLKLYLTYFNSVNIAVRCCVDNVENYVRNVNKMLVTFLYFNHVFCVLK